MRCVECETDPLTPAHYCECCGRKLSVKEHGVDVPEAVNTEAAKLAAARATAAKVVADRAAAAKAARTRSEKAHYSTAMNPDEVNQLTTVPVSPGRRARAMLLAAASVVIIAAIGITQGPRWFEIQPQTTTQAQPAQPAPVAAQAANAGRQATPASRSNTKEVAKVRKSAAPVGRVFEPGDVDQSPKIATRVAPRLPPDVRAGAARKDIVVVRVLVSQTGRPFRINLLRGSKGGRSLDDAVVAAVNQWTFSPARKQGEPVSCWYNVGVPVGQAN